MRAQKDAKILDMAMEKKRKMEEAKKSGMINWKNICIWFPMIKYELSLIGSNSYSYNSGGFVGVNQLTSKKLKETYV